MMHDLVVELLPARHGDAILLEWPDPSSVDRPIRRMLVDCGPAYAYAGVADRLRELESPHIDRLVLTHVDADHIEGMILAVNDQDLALEIDEVWYNGSPHLVDKLGAAQGEILGALITERKLCWNQTFDGKAAKATDIGQSLTRVPLPGDLTITVLAPAQSDLQALRDYWSQALKEAGLTMGSTAEALELLRNRPRLKPKSGYLGAKIPDVERLARARRGTDTAVPNRSSIVLLVEHKERRVLLAGDSTPAVLQAAIERLLDERGVEQLELTDFKLPHHGSAKNITREILALAPAERYLFSTDGGYFNHPDDEAVATVIRHGQRAAELIFNYDNPRTRPWDVAALRECFGYACRYPEKHSVGIRIDG